MNSGIPSDIYYDILSGIFVEFLSGFLSIWFRSSAHSDLAFAVEVRCPLRSNTCKGLQEMVATASPRTQRDLLSRKIP